MLSTLASPQAAAQWLVAHVSGSLRTDSRAVRAGDGFIAWPGHAVDGRQYVHAALTAGAAACLVEAQGVQAFGFDDTRVAAVAGQGSAVRNRETPGSGPGRLANSKRRSV